MTSPTGVLLMTYGSAVTSTDVPDYLRSVAFGNDPDPELVAEFQRRYDLVGGSPLIAITQAQGEALQALLDEGSPGAYRVEIGMLHSAPRIADGVAKLAADGVRRIIGIVLAPQYSPIIMGRYPKALQAAAAEHLGEGGEVGMAGPWHTTDGWLDTLAELVGEARAELDPATPVLFTTHSLPEAVVARDPAYLAQLNETIAGVVERSGLPEGSWRFAYQSAGHSPEPWLTPDLKDLLPEYAAEGHKGILVVPIQFLADHLEILFDIDVAAREEAEEAGLVFNRTELPNTRPAFIRALAEVARREEKIRS